MGFFGKRPRLGEDAAWDFGDPHPAILGHLQARMHLSGKGVGRLEDQEVLPGVSKSTGGQLVRTLSLSLSVSLWVPW